jgi:hypothetical protein
VAAVPSPDPVSGRARGLRRPWLAGVCAALVAALLLGSAGAAVTTTTFRSVADAWVAQNRADANFGTDKRLKVQGSPIQRGYLRFNLQGLSGTIRKATLRLSAASSSSVGYSVRAVADNGWGETTITYANAPAPSATVTGSSGAFASSQWVAVEVTPLVSGNGLLTVALTSTSSTGMSFDSREAGTSVAPQLVVETTTDVRPTNTSPPTISGTAGDGQTLTADSGTWSGTQPISYAYQWRRCDGSGASCVDIAGAAAPTYTLVSADVGSTLRVVVTASNDLASSATSAATAVVAAVAPRNTAPPSISGAAQQGQTLSASPGAWSGTSPSTYAYQWRRCDSAGANCTDIVAAAAQTYTLTSADVGSTVRVAVTASNSAGSSTASSTQTAVVQAAPIAPSNTSPPTVSGTVRDGQTLSADPGTWSGTQPISYAYQWRRCDASGANCADVAAATSSSYLLGSSDVGSTMRVAVSASNSVGSGSATSAQTAVVTSASVAGPCGTSSRPPQTFQHVIWIWMENKSYSQIIGNTSSAPYTNSLASQCGVATNYRAVTHPSLPNYIAATSGDYWGIADDNPPASHPLSVPSIYSQVKAAGAAWRDYEESAPGNCPQDSSGLYVVRHDPAPYYTTISSDCAQWDVPMGTTTAGNFLNDLNADTLPAFSFVTPDNCNDTHDCTIATGDSWLQAWVPLITSNRAYQSGSTVLFITYDEDDGSATNQVATVVASPYTPAGTTSSAAFNHYSLLKTTEQLLGIGTFLGHAGDASTNSMRGDFNLAATATPPANSSPPTISGTAQEGQTLTASPGAWSGTQPLAYAYQWRRCDTLGASCVDVAGATAQTYLLGSVDVGSTMRVGVTASNGAGSSSATSSQTLVIQAAPAAPTNASPPTIAGTAQAGQTLTASPGSWSGTQPISYAYQWRRCDTAGVSCVDIVPAAAQTYTLTSADVGATVRVAVTASNSAGSSTVSSAQTAVVQSAPVAPSNTSPPTIAGTAQAGQTLTASPGSWSGTQPISYAYQWLKCDAAGANCADVASATSSSYLLAPTDVGSTIRVRVTASSSAGSSSATSAQTAAVAAAAGCAPRTSSYSSTVLATPGVIGYWRLGEASGTVACDSKGANNGSYQGGTTLGQAGALANDADTAVAFNGSSGWVQVASSSVNVGDRFTLEAWAKRGLLGGSNNQVIASKQSNAWVLMFNTSDQLVLRRSNVADVALSTVKVSDTSRWHYVAATKNGTAVKLYLDGADVTGTVTNQTMSDNTLPLAIGQSSASAYFKGTVDEVALYNVALTAAQISSHYASG